MKTTDLGNDWYASENDDGSMTLRNSEKGQRIDLAADSVLRLRRIIVQAAMALVDKTLLDAFAEPMSDDEKAARELGWQSEDEAHGSGSGSGCVHPAGRWARDWKQALETDVAPGWQSRIPTPSDEIPY